MVAVLPQPVKPSGLSVEVATRRELVAADRLDTPMGAAAMTLAVRLDSSSDTGAAMAAMVKQLGEALERATAGATRADDAVDELRSRRERRRSAG